MRSEPVELLKSLCQRHPGVDMIDFAADAGGVTPKRAWAHVAGMASKPSLVFPEDRMADALEAWWRLALSEGVLSKQGTCLLSVSGVSFGAWARIRLPEYVPVLDIFSVHQGSPEFIAMNEEGRLFLAVTAEEDELWLYLVKRQGEQLLTIPLPS